MPTRPTIRRRSAIPQLYGRLDPDTTTIRLFEFHDNEHGEISGSLGAYNISDVQCPQWIALSYTWDLFEVSRHSPVSHRNSQEPLSTINVDGYNIVVRANLLEALHAILAQKAQMRTPRNNESECNQTGDRDTFGFVGAQRPEDWRFFWIDAICVNQNDQEEKQHQIGLMHQIYSQASSVIGWLTPFEGHLQPETKSILLQLAQKGRDSRGQDESMSGKSQLPSTPPRAGASVHHRAIVHNAFWQRMWIVPEIILASKITFLYGSIWLTEGFMHDILRNHTAPATQILRHRDIFQKAGRKRSAIDFQELLDAYSFKQCTDVRDRVFALLSLLPSDFPIQADYSLSTTQIFLLLLEYQGTGATSLHMKSWSLALNLDWRDPVIESHLWLHARRNRSRENSKAISIVSQSQEIRTEPTVLDVVQPLVLFMFYRILMPVSIESFDLALKLFEITTNISSAIATSTLSRLIFDTFGILITFFLGGLWTILFVIFGSNHVVKKKPG